MKAESKQQKGKNQTNRSKQTKQIRVQENQNFELKIQKVQKQLASLNLDIESLLEQKSFKDNTQKALARQRKKLENCFLFKDYKATKQIDQIQKQNIQNEAKNIEPSKQKVKNHFRDVNQTTLRYIKQLQAVKDKEGLREFQNSGDHEQNQSQQPNRKLQCQSLHLKQIFNPEQTLNHSLKASKFQQKLALLYEKIKLNLQREEPYLHEKILERIKRQAQSYTRKKVLVQIDKLIKRNSVWMTQETNRVNNQLQEQKVEEICVNNLGLMKKIMGKKVSNNDWIFQNYSDQNFIKGSTLGFPVLKIAHQYQQVLQKLQEQRIAEQLNMVRKGNNAKIEKNSEQSLKQLLSEKSIQNLMNEKRNSQDLQIQNEKQLFDRVEKLQRQIQNLNKI